MDNAIIATETAKVRIIVKKRKLYYTEINYNGPFKKEDESKLLQSIKEKYKDADNISIVEINFGN